MIHVLAIITTKPGKRDEVLPAFRANMPVVHAEAGCIEYGPVIDAEGGAGAKFGSDTFVVVEKWESLDHLGAHARSPHMAAYAGAKTVARWSFATSPEFLPAGTVRRVLDRSDLRTPIGRAYYPSPKCLSKIKQQPRWSIPRKFSA